jgi:hypothetical protein
MTPADRKAFLEVVVGFAELKGKQLSAPALELYWRAMQDWSIEDFRAAAEQLLRTCAFMPTPKDFEDLRKAGRPSAGEAWERALAHARDLPASGGYLQERPSGDALLDAAARMVGGYKAIANASERDLQFIAQRFAEHFETLEDREDIREALPALTGGPKLERMDDGRGLVAVYEPARRIS